MILQGGINDGSSAIQELAPTRVDNPPFQWVGGKWEMAGKIIGAFPDHELYVEVCGGAAGVLLRKEPSRIEVYNDLDHALGCFFRACRDYPEELSRLVALTEYSRERFQTAAGSLGGPLSHPTPENLTDPGYVLEVAYATAILGRMSMGGRLGGSWSRSLGHRRAGLSSSVARWLLLPETILQVASRLREVQIENLPAVDCLRQYDRPRALHYVDPPYVPATRSAGLYRHEMSLDRHAELLEALCRCRGAVVLSGYANDLYDRELRHWERLEWDAVCRSNITAKGTNAGRPTRREVLWIKPSRP